MKLYVTAKPNAKITRVDQRDATHFVITVKEPARDNKANVAILKALAKHLGTSSAMLELISGHTSKQKIINVYSV